MPFFGCLLAILFAASAAAAGPKEKKSASVYLGPGSEKLSAEEYERVYKNYIQTSILLGYPFLKEKAPACDQAVGSIFRQAGMFSYPVPAEAQQVLRSVKTMGAHKVETYELAGVIVQLSRFTKNGALDGLLMINSASTKASRRLAQFAKRELLKLEKDPVTGLERVRGIPVGFPHPFLTNEGQGLYVKELRFNGKLDGCEPLGFQDNAWVGGFDLSDTRCAELQGDAEKVWHETLSPADFSQHELKRMKDIALKSAIAKGSKKAEAEALVEKYFVPPLTNEINIVGSAMRNLAQCNLLALGRAGKGRVVGGEAPAGGGAGNTGDEGTGVGTAK